MSLVDRLRGVVGVADRTAGQARSLHQAAEPPAEAAGSGRFDLRAVAEMLGGDCQASDGQSHVVVDSVYPPGRRHGRTAVADAAPGGDGTWPSLSVLDPDAGRRPLIFLDLETTGLAGGAGTYAFLVGCGWFDGAAFRVRQFLLAQYGAERRLLEQVAATVATTGALATYNGKTFDVPLIETRFAFHRLPARLGSMLHVDLLHPARRLWRDDDGAALVGAGPGSCRLSAIERSVLGVTREGDVPGAEIPARYFHFVRHGDARPLAAVLEHNRLDLLSLALLTARAARLLDEGAEAAATPREALGLGRLYARRGMMREARACFARAVSLCAPRDLAVKAEALRGAAVASRRLRAHEDAACAWRALLDLDSCSPRMIGEACEALAVHHEHREGDLRAARDLARRSLGVTSPSRQQAIQHRLARLDRKLAASLSLF